MYWCPEHWVGVGEVAQATGCCQRRGDDRAWEMLETTYRCPPTRYVYWVCINVVYLHSGWYFRARIDPILQLDDPRQPTTYDPRTCDLTTVSPPNPLPSHSLHVVLALTPSPEHDAPPIPRRVPRRPRSNLIPGEVGDFFL